MTTVSDPIKGRHSLDPDPNHRVNGELVPVQRQKEARRALWNLIDQALEWIDAARIKPSDSPEVFKRKLAAYHARRASV